MKSVKLNAITTAAQRRLDQFGDIWNIVDERPALDRPYNLSKFPHYYLSPHKNTKPAGLGSFWIACANDPAYEYSFVPTPRVQRAKQ